MRRFRNRWLASLLASAPLVAPGLGCGESTNVQLKQVAPADVPKAPAETPKNQRPKAGSSSGMNYDPSGATPKQ